VVAAGKTLFVENCASCHEPDAVGSGRAPNLRGVGAATVDLWLRSGWMPLAEPGAQPETKPPRFTSAEIGQIVAYVTSLAPGGVPIPEVNPSAGSVQVGFDLFALNCAGCHTITGAGDALANGIKAPSLHGVNAVQIAEAIETGPGNMPRFSKYQFSPAEVNSLVAYILHYVQTPTSPGGISLGGVGPVAEGFVGLFVGVGACVLIGFWIGDRTEKEEDEGHGDDHGDDHGGHGDDSHGGTDDADTQARETDRETEGGGDAEGQGGTEPADG
jgi:ubiquinol-cytochrome c reductase cytochrome c subunit